MDYLEKLKKFEAKWSYQEKVFFGMVRLCAALSGQKVAEEANAFGTILFAILFIPATYGPFVGTILLLDNVLNFWISLVPAGLIQWQYQKLRDPK